MLNILRYLGFAAHSRGVNEDILVLAADDLAVYRVTGRTGDIGDYGTLLARNKVDERRFADIRLSDNGYLYSLLILGFGFLGGHKLENRVEKIARAVPVYRRYRYGVAETQIVELVKLGRGFAYAVVLIYSEDHGLAALGKHCRNVRIVRGNARCEVGHKDNTIRRLYGEHSLLAHLSEDYVVGLGLDTARVNQHKLAVQPFTAAVNSVAGNARGIVHDRQALADQLIEKRGLPHVGSSYNRY